LKLRRRFKNFSQAAIATDSDMKILALRARLGERRRRFTDTFSTPNMRSGRRQVRRWLAANGLILVVVSAMMVIAWMLADR
jgi:hypothetical protein